MAPALRRGAVVEGHIDAVRSISTTAGQTVRVCPTTWLDPERAGVWSGVTIGRRDSFETLLATVLSRPGGGRDLGEDAK